MRIEEYCVRRYGPLPDSGRVVLGDFCLFFGNNEEGKTLTIDALLKLLFGKKTKVFKNIARVDEEPEGFIVLRDEKGQSVKLPEKGDVTALFSLTPSQARNIFIIRDSDLSLLEECEHFREVTDRLTGMRTERIEKVKRFFLDLGKITPGGEFRNIKDEKLLSRVSSASKLLGEIGELEGEARQEGLDSLEREIADSAQRIGLIDRELGEMELSRKRQEYEKGRNTLETLFSAEESLRGLEKISAEDERSWTRHEQDISREQERKKELQVEVERKEKDLLDLRERLQEEQLLLQSLERKKSKIDGLKPQLAEFEIKRGELEQKRAKKRFFVSAALVSAGLFIVSLLGVILHPSPVFLYPFLFLFCAATFFFGVLSYLVVREGAWVRGFFERIKLELAKIDIAGEQERDILSAIRQLEDDYAAVERREDELLSSSTLLEREIRNIKEKEIPEIEERAARAERAVQEIREKSGVRSLKVYREKQEEVQQKENLRDRQAEVLGALFSREGNDLPNRISYWKRKVGELEKYKDAALHREYRAEEESRLKDEKQGVLRRRDELEEKRKGFADRLGSFEREANAVFPLDSDYLHCETTVDLEAVKNRLKEFVETHENLKENALTAIGIFEGIEREEEEKISHLFGKESLVSAYFSQITGGLYTEVQFSPEERKIRVQKNNGEFLVREKLSGGANDQLYFSIRLGLGESLLRGKKAFFIMDDPFVKADMRRLREQLGILKRISRSGWQVLYFTAKQEVKEVLSKDIRDKSVQLYSIGRI